MKLKQFNKEIETEPPTNSIRQFYPYNSRIDTYFSNLITELFEAASDKANERIGNSKAEKRDRVVESDGGYKCIHLSIEEFISSVSAMLKKQGIDDEKVNQLTFLDIGCGVGQKVYLAKVFGFQSYGLELREELIKEGKRLFKKLRIITEYDTYDNIGRHDTYDNIGRHDFVFIQGNALTFPDFAKFDVMYFYCPLFDNKLQVAMELHLAKTAKVGAIVIPKLAKGIFTFANVTQQKEYGWKCKDRHFVKVANP